MRWLSITRGLSILLGSLLLLLVLHVSLVWGQTGAEPRRGGTLRVGNIAEANTLDMHWNPESLGQMIASHVVEPLYTRGLDFSYIPMLAEGPPVSNDGLVYTVKLRRGVLFHHGTELTAADVVASLLRYGKVSRRGQRFFRYVVTVQALDRYTVQVRLHRPTAFLLPFLAASIYPQDVLQEAGEGQVQRHIGTGPFQFADRQPGRITLQRFARYQARSEPPNGYGGRRTAWLDTVVFLYFPDDATRLAALEVGEVDFAPVPHAAYDRLRAHPALTVQIEKPGVKVMTMFNKRQGLFTNVKLRQAALAALDMRPILQEAVGSAQFYRLDPSLSSQEEPWWTDTGSEFYNQANPAKARQLLQEAGYQGEPVRYMAAHDGIVQHTVARMVQQQLEAVGFRVDVQLMEWKTLVERRRQPELWEAFTVWNMASDPALYPYLHCDWPGWNCDADFVRLLQTLEEEGQFERRYRLWQEVHRLFWERVPFLLHGEAFWLRGMLKRVRGPFDMSGTIGWYFWNVWLEP